MASGKKTTNSKDSSPALAANLSLPLSSQSTEPVGPDSVAIQIDRPPARRRTFKIIVLGDSGVGKTCLTYRFCQGRFPQRTDATVGVDFREKTVQVGSEMVKLQLWDTAGQERFRKSMVPHYYRNVHAIVYVYDVTKRSSFENIVQWMAESDMHNPGRHLPSVLVGNKCDSPIHMVAVHTNVAQRFAESHQMELFETSAKEESKSDHVESIFITLICKLMLLRTGLTPTPDDSKLRPQLVELKPVIIKKHEDCTC